jgi:methionyl-tRNA formyltransferase
LSLAGADLLLETVDGLEKGLLQPITQDPTLATKAPRLDPGEGEIDWSKPAEAVNNHIRGLSSQPGAFTYRDGCKLKIYSSEPVEQKTRGHRPGEIVARDDVSGFVVSTASGWLRLREVQPQGKKRMKAEDYLRGYPLAEGEVLG